MTTQIKTATGLGLEEKTEISNLVNETVTQFWGEEAAFQLCSRYAFIGLKVLQSIRPKQEQYAFAAGSLLLEVEAGEEDRGSGRLEMNAHNPLVSGQEFHCWIAEMPTDRSRVSFIDLTARHYKKWSDLIGLRWDRKQEPEYIWSSVEELPKMGLHLLIHRSLSNEIREALEEDTTTLLAARHAVEIAKKLFL